MIGDFNDTIHPLKRNGKPIYFNDQNSLIHFMTSTCIVDLGSLGSRSTWCNKREGFHCIHKRLNHAITNSRWIHFFPKPMVTNLLFFTFDHAPLLLHLQGLYEPFSLRTFRIIFVWLLDVWSNSTNNSEAFMQKLKRLSI